VALYRLPVIALACCVGFAATTAQGMPFAVTVIDTSDGVGADTYVQILSGGDGGNFGSDTVMRTKATDASGELYRKAYMRFDLSALGLLPGEREIIDATLDLVVDGADSTGLTFSVFGLQDGDAGEGWGEGTITYASAPANTSLAANDNNLLSNATLLGSFSGSTSGSTVSLAGPELAAFIDEDTDSRATLIITRDFIDPVFAGPIHDFRTKEFTGSFAPTLTITSAEVPEPSAAALLPLGMVVLWRRRRRGNRL